MVLFYACTRSGLFRYFMCIYVMKTHNTPLCNCRSLSLSLSDSITLLRFRSFTQHDTTVTTITAKTNSQSIFELGYFKWKGTNPSREKIVTKRTNEIRFSFKFIVGMQCTHIFSRVCICVYFVDTRVQTKGIVETLRQSNWMENEIHPPLFSMIHEMLFKTELNNNNKYLYGKANRTYFIQILQVKWKQSKKRNEK